MDSPPHWQRHCRSRPVWSSLAVVVMLPDVIVPKETELAATPVVAVTEPVSAMPVLLAAVVPRAPLAAPPIPGVPGAVSGVFSELQTTNPGPNR
jgi:hypothetical protein